MGIKALHDSNVRHKSLSADKIICSESGIKILDVSDCAFISEQSQSETFLVDMKRFGILAYQLATGYPQD